MHVSAHHQADFQTFPSSHTTELFLVLMKTQPLVFNSFNVILKKKGKIKLGNADLLLFCIYLHF